MASGKRLVLYNATRCYNKTAGEVSCVVLHSSFPEDAIQYNTERYATGGHNVCMVTNFLCEEKRRVL